MTSKGRPGSPAVPHGRVLVTGAASGLGAVVLAEARKQGLDVVGVDRPEHSPAPQSTRGEPIRLGPLDDPALLREHFEGVDRVIHTLLDDRYQASYEDLAKVNLDLSERLFEAAAEAGCRRFVWVSRARICHPSDRYVGEEWEVRPSNSVEQSVHDAEILLQGLANRRPSGPELVVLRAAPMYGHPTPESSAVWLMAPPLLALYFDLLPSLSGGPRCHWVHVRDAARAAVHLSAAEVGRVATYFVADDTPMTVGEFSTLLLEAYGYPVGIRIPVPPSGVMRRILTVVQQPVVLSILDAALRRSWQLLYPGDASGFSPDLSRVTFTGLHEDALFRNDRLKATGFALSVPDLRRGLPDAIRGYQRAGLLPAEKPSRSPTESLGPRLASHFTETMEGRLRRRDAPEDSERDIGFTATMTASGARLPLRDKVWHIDGRMTADGLATDVPIQGTLEVAIMGKRQLVYEFGFTGDDDRPYRLRGVKTIRFRDPVKSFTHMAMSIHDERGDEVASGHMTFDLRRDLVDFVRSFGVERTRSSA